VLMRRAEPHPVFPSWAQHILASEQLELHWPVGDRLWRCKHIGWPMRQSTPTHQKVRRNVAGEHKRYHRTSRA
jgi:hypothetical protein